MCNNLIPFKICSYKEHAQLVRTYLITMFSWWPCGVQPIHCGGQSLPIPLNFRQWTDTSRNPHRTGDVHYRSTERLSDIWYDMIWCCCAFIRGYAVVCTSTLPSACRDIPSSIQTRLQPSHGRGLWFSRTIAEVCDEAAWSGRLCIGNCAGNDWTPRADFRSATRPGRKIEDLCSWSWRCSAATGLVLNPT